MKKILLICAFAMSSFSVLVGTDVMATEEVSETNEELKERQALKKEMQTKKAEMQVLKQKMQNLKKGGKAKNGKQRTQKKLKKVGRINKKKKR